MIAERPYIAYTLPISIVSQALLGKKIENSWINIENFLSTCTNTNIERPNDSIHLEAHSADEDNNEPLEPALIIIEKTRKIFGIGKEKPIGYHYPSYEPHKQVCIKWDIEVENLKTALDYIISGQPYPKYNLGPIELVLSYDFNLVSPFTKEILPNQQFKSSILICLGRRSWISPHLSFPFEEPNKDFWDYIEYVKPYLPFKFNVRHLRIVKANKKGTNNVWLKL